jgi:hypothetical protein
MKLATIALAVAFALPTTFAIAEGSLNYSTPAARPVVRGVTIGTFRGASFRTARSYRSISGYRAQRVFRGVMSAKKESTLWAANRAASWLWRAALPILARNGPVGPV